MKKYFTLFILMAFTWQYLAAQVPGVNVFDVKKMLPTSPDVAMIARFGDIPVGHYTGTANISVPLYTIKEDGLEIPIVLKYHSSGIKVEDEAGWVGLGWSLEPSGLITQVFNGKEDEQDNLHLRDGYSFLKEGMLLGSYSGKYTDNTQEALRFAKIGEGQPDFYYVNFPGFSGKFYINKENGEIVFLNRSASVKIIKSGAGWVATTMDGNKFYFSVLETVNSPTPFENSGRTWKLSQIELHNGRVLNFEYSNGHYQSNTFSQTWHDEYPFNLGSGNVESSKQTAYHDVKYLKAINTSHLRIEFQLEDRDDLVNSVDDDGISGNGNRSTKRLKTLIVSDLITSRVIRSFDFNFGYFNYSTVGGSYVATNFTSPSVDPLGKRLKLVSLRENGHEMDGTIKQGQPYLFEYEESISLPLKTSFARDFWGYYNGKNNTSLLPDLSYYRFSGFPEYQNIPIYVLNSYGQGANRSVNTSVQKAGMLKKLHYPTGGYSVFNYESNTFSNHNYPDIDQIAELTVNGNVLDKNNAGDIYSKQFSISQNVTVHFTVSINKGPNQSLTFESLLPSTVTLTRIGNGGSNITPIKTWQMIDNVTHRSDFAADGMFTWIEDIELVYMPNTYYVLVAGLPNSLGPQNTSNNSASVSASYQYATMPSTVVKLNSGAGLRIQSIQHFSEGGVIASQKNYDYTINGNTSGLLMSPLKHLHLREIHFSRLYNTPATEQNPEGMVYAENTTKNIWFVSSNSYIPFSDAASGNLVGYNKVKVLETGSLESNGTHVLHFHNFASNTKINNPDIPDPRNSLIIQEEYLKASGDTIKKSIYGYIEQEAKYLRGFKVFDNFIGSDPPLLGDIGYGHIIYPIGKRYTIDSYPNNAHWFLLNKKIEYDYNDGKLLTKQEDYQYNTLGQVILTTSTNSQGVVEKFYVKYPIDVPGSPTGVEQVMRDQSLFNSVLEQYSLVGTTEKARVRNNYQHFSGSPVTMVNTEMSFGGGTFKEDVRYVAYGDFKKPISILNNGMNTVLVWSYNSIYPIAKIENADLSTVASILGEQNLINLMRNPRPSDSDLNSFFAPLIAHQSMKDAFVTIYKFDPLVGMTSSTDSKGLTTYYEYDSFQRLKHIKDQHGNIVKSYCYNYAGQVMNCNP